MRRRARCPGSREIGRVEPEHDALRDDGHAVPAPRRQALDDRADQRVDDRLERDVPAAELLGDERQRRAGGLADAEREVARLPTHGDHEVPARRRLRVHHQVLDDLDTDVTRGLEAERVDVRRQIEIVVDRLRHVHDADAPGRLLLELHRGERGVVAADRDQLRHVEAQQRDDGILELLRVAGRIGARDADVRAAAEVDAADVVDAERRHVVDVAPHDPLEAVADAEHVDPLEDRADGGRADHAVDAGRRAAADQDRQFLPLTHPTEASTPSLWRAATRLNPRRIPSPHRL